MLLEIPRILSERQLRQINQIIAGAEFVAGTLTAGSAAARVKHNEEMKAERQRMELLIRIITASLAGNPIFRSAALPYRMADPILARYRPGMSYGNHVDDPIMGQSGPRFRTDVSMTLFLCDPGSYEGGELEIRTTFGTHSVKLAAGDAVLYPSSSMHRVAEVTRGERTVALGWIQSYVRDPAQRELLYELDQARERLLREEPEAETTAQVNRSYANLLRMWSEV